MSTPEPKRRKRRTKAEIEAERISEANKPIDPRFWMGLGGLLLIVGLCIYLDPIGFEQADSSGGDPWIKIILELLVVFAGKNPVAAALGVLGGLSLIWGIRGWLREKPGANKEKPAS
jgi:hypothetical protein